jgi:D-alanyl-D-alanine dipeptidase
MNKRSKLFIFFSVTFLLLVGVVIAVKYFQNDNQEENPIPEKMVQVSDNEKVRDSIHVATGLIADEGLNLVIAHCTGCHSAQLITQNRATKEGWVRVIRWMQETQNLWDLGESEEAIVNYLTRNYSPEHRGRRAPLTEIEWYELEE